MDFIEILGFILAAIATGWSVYQQWLHNQTFMLIDSLNTDVDHMLNYISQEKNFDEKEKAIVEKLKAVIDEFSEYEKQKNTPKSA